MMTNQAQVKLKSPACTAQANDINTNTCKVVPRWITRKQTRKINVPLCNFNFFEWDSKSGVGVTHCVALFPGCGRHVRQGKQKRERCERGQMQKGGGLTLWGGKVLQFKPRTSSETYTRPKSRPTCKFLEVRGPLNRNSCNRQTSATTDTRKEATSEAKARRLGLA
jgi:hypothetical protein